MVAPDLRGHGETITQDSDDLSVERLTSDIVNIFQQLFKNVSKSPPMILMGHSMGGALAVHVASTKQLNNLQVKAFSCAIRLIDKV